MNIIELAKEAGFPSLTEYGEECLERFAALVRAEALKESAKFAYHVRAEALEEAAKLADAELMNTNILTSYPPKSSAAWNIAAAIRSLK